MWIDKEYPKTEKEVIEEAKEKLDKVFGSGASRRFEIKVENCYFEDMENYD